MASLLEPVAGNRVANGQHKKAETKGEQDQVQHLIYSLPNNDLVKRPLSIFQSNYTLMVQSSDDTNQDFGVSADRAFVRSSALHANT
jgi:hypothetical protein